jgi:hypothetical protein
MRGFLVAAALLAGCSTPPSADDACQRYAASYCKLVDDCSQRATAARYGSLLSCQERERAACHQRLAAPGTSRTPSFEAGCSLALPSLNCTALFANATFLSCIAPPGTREELAPCIDDAQCETGTCNRGASRVCGTCGLPAHSGESCDTTSCARGLICLENLCVAPAAQDASCDPTHPCAYSLSCADGTCSPAIENAGDDCDPDQSIAAGCDLDQGLLCDPMSKVCVAAPPPPGVLPDGALCDPGGPPCAVPAKCVAGTCTLPDLATCG